MAKNFIVSFGTDVIEPVSGYNVICTAAFSNELIAMRYALKHGAMFVWNMSTYSMIAL